MKKQTRYILIFGLAILIIGGVFVTTLVRDSKTSQSQNPLDTKIVELTNTIQSDPQKIDSYIQLSGLYTQKIRETADSSYYIKIDELLAEALKIDPNNAEIFAEQARLSLGRHKFKDAKVLIEKSLAINPAEDSYYGILGDAELELGNYSEAVNAYQKEVNMNPNFSSFSRIAYIRELYGDIPGAIAAMDSAIKSGSMYSENIAWAYTERAKLKMHTNLTNAEQDFATALQIVPGYAPALNGLGKVAFFKKDLAQAETHFEAAYEALPIAQHATDLGDFYTYKGDTVRANQYYALTQISYADSMKSGLNTDLEEALFLADHNLELPQALEKAERAFKDRPTIYAVDYLAWAHFKLDDAPKAATYSKQALRLGEHDPLILYHQGMIALKNGNNAEAKRLLSKAVAVHPYFSLLHVDETHNTLKAL